MTHPLSGVEQGYCKMEHKRRATSAREPLGMLSAELCMAAAWSAAHPDEDMACETACEDSYRSAQPQEIVARPGGGWPDPPACSHAERALPCAPPSEKRCCSEQLLLCPALLTTSSLCLALALCLLVLPHRLHLASAHTPSRLVLFEACLMASRAPSSLCKSWLFPPKMTWY